MARLYVRAVSANGVGPHGHFAGSLAFNSSSQFNTTTILGACSAPAALIIRKIGGRLVSRAPRVETISYGPKSSPRGPTDRHGLFASVAVQFSTRSIRVTDGRCLSPSSRNKKRGPSAEMSKQRTSAHLLVRR